MVRKKLFLCIPRGLLWQKVYRPIFCSIWSVTWTQRVSSKRPWHLFRWLSSRFWTQPYRIDLITEHKTIHTQIQTAAAILSNLLVYKRICHIPGRHRTRVSTKLYSTESSLIARWLAINVATICSMLGLDLCRPNKQSKINSYNYCNFNDNVIMSLQYVY